MRILIQGRNLTQYLAKCHEALRTGLRRTYDARCFGPGYPGYRPRFLVRDFPAMVRHVFPDGVPPDLVIADSQYHLADPAFSYAGLRKLGGTRTCVIGDYWSIKGATRDRFVDIVQEEGLAAVIAYFPGARAHFADTAIAGRIAWLPPCFDPQIFNDWRVAKRWDVGFLAAGTADPMPTVYPERIAIHQQLLRQGEFSYLWAKHPGWRERRLAHALVGKGFAQAIGSCRIFITTCGVHRHPQPKLFEALASGPLVMSDEPEGAAELGLVDGRTYVRIDPSDVMDKIRHYLSHSEELLRIAAAGHALAIERHSCYARAKDLPAALRGLPPQGP